MFNEYDFKDYCTQKYVNGLGQDDAHAFYEMGGWEQSEVIRGMGAWQLMVWLGEYLTSEEE